MSKSVELIKTPFESYRNLVCFDRTPYIVLKDLVGIDDVELFFIDRYLGFDFNDGNFSVECNRFNDFLMSEEIEKNCELNVTDLRKEIKFMYLDKGSIPCILGQFEYPDPKQPFMLTMKYIIHDYDECNVRFTRPSSLDPLHDVIWKRDVFEDTLVKAGGKVSSTVFENFQVLKSLNDFNMSEKINKILNEYYRLTSCEMKEKYNNFINRYSPILKVRDYHNNRLDEYLSIGIDRNKYSDFIRRIDQMLFPQLLVANYLVDNLSNNYSTHKLKAAIESIKKSIDETAKIINFFFIKQDKKMFLKYVEKLNILDENYKIFLFEYNKLMNEIIK